MRAEGEELGFLNYFLLFLFSRKKKYTYIFNLSSSPEAASPEISEKSPWVNGKHPVPIEVKSLNIQDPYINRGNVSLFRVQRSQDHGYQRLLLPPSIPPSHLAQKMENLTVFRSLQRRHFQNTTETFPRLRNKIPRVQE